MKSTAIISSMVVAAAAVNALSDCIITCQQSEAASSGCGDNYNTTLCMCSETFATNVKACLYQNDCSTDVSTFYNSRSDFCDGEEETSDSDGADTTETDGELGSCVLSCQAEVAGDAGCSSNYNETSCYCDNEDFATDVKVCLYQNCSSYVPIFYNYRASVCGTSNSSEYYSSIAAANPTAGLATSTGASEAATATSTSSPTSTAESGTGKLMAAAWSLGAVAIIFSYNML